jgi:hypothetical protein
MTTRHVSARGEYPFIPGTYAAGLDVLKGILDLFVVVRGVPTGNLLPVQDPIIELLETTAAGSDMTLSFRARERDGRFWDFDIDILGADTPGSIGQALSNNAYVYAIAIYDTTFFANNFVSTPGINATVEPSRTQWQTEAVERVVFENVVRCNSEEDFGDIVTVQVINASDPNPEIKLANGYNTVLSYEDNQLSLVAGIGLGEGQAPSYGNTDTVCCPEPDPEEIEGIFSINGLLPVNGNIDLSTSSGLYFNKSTGLIEVLKRN